MIKNLSVRRHCVFLAFIATLSAVGMARAGDAVSRPPKAAAAGAEASQTHSAVGLNHEPAKPIVLRFEQLAGYPLKLTDELQMNTNRAAWADAQVNAMIPESIRKLDGQRVIVEGFMVPVAFDKERLTEFVLVRDMPGCCFGFPPNPHEWVKAVVKSPKIKVEFENPVRVGGVFHVGAERQAGYLSGIYSLDAYELLSPTR
jgi:hypothetical protein